MTNLLIQRPTSELLRPTLSGPQVLPHGEHEKASYQKFSDTKPFLALKINFEVNAQLFEAFRQMRYRYGAAQCVDERLSRRDLR